MMVRAQQQMRPEQPQITRRERGTAVDLWIKRELQRSYDEILSEPVPDSLLCLLAGFPARS